MTCYAKKIALLLPLCFCLFGFSQTPTTLENWREGLATKSPLEMNKEELRAYKDAVEKRAAELGFVQQGPKYTPLTQAEKAALAPIPKRIPGTTIQYDSGVVTGFHTAIASGRALVNRFDTAIGDSGTMCCFPVENSGTITMITFHMLRTSSNNVTFSLYSNIMGTTAKNVTSKIIPAAVGLNTHTLGTMTMGQYANGPFLAGLFQFNTMFTRIGVDTNTNGGQGHHLASINDNTTMGARGTGVDLRDVGGLNLVFRIGGNVATPVELMNFEIE